MNIGKTLSSYFWWTHERGSLHYDVMVTVILLFIFVTPRYVNFKDRPVEYVPHPTGVVVNPDGQGGFFYQVDASAVGTAQGADLEKALLKVIEPIAGEVKLLDYKGVSDRKGRVSHYLVRVRR